MGVITTNINNANKDLVSKLVFREDIINAITDFKDAKADNEHSKRSQIISMFKAHNIYCGKNLSAEEYMKLLECSGIPSVSTFPDFCWGEMVSLFENYKHPKDYMERLVNNLVAPEYNLPGTSVRLKILKQFLGKLNYLEGTRLFDKELKEFIINEYFGDIANIKEDIFEKYLTPGHIEDTYKLLEAIIEVYEKFLYKENEVDEELNRIIIPYYSEVEGMNSLSILKFIHERNHRPTKDRDSNYIMKDEYPQLVEELFKHLNERLEKQKENFGLLIEDIESYKKDRKEQFFRLKQAICDCNYDWNFIDENVESLIKHQFGTDIDCEKTDMEVMCALLLKVEESARKFAKINDGIIASFKEYKSKKNKAYEEAKDRSRKKQKKIELIHVCNELSEGRFKKGYGEMKETLFYFAFAFDMKVNYEINNKNYNLERDIDKQLFENYYTDNIIRYMKNYQNNGMYEEPIGISIRYNNFVEIVYLYWLSRSNDEHSQYQKLMNAIEMNNNIVDRKGRAWKKVLTLKKKTGKKYKEANAIAKYKGVPSVDIKRHFYGQGSEEIPFKLSKDDFENAVLEKYDLDEQYKYSGPRSYEGFYNQMELRTAENEYSKLLSELIDKAYIKVGKETMDTLPIINFFEKIYFENGLPEKSESNELKKLINKINKRLVAFCNKDTLSKKVTRTNLLFAYYLLFIAKNSDDYGEVAFNDFYVNYIDELNDILVKSSFPMISEKNLIDMILVYSAFINLRINC